jgi:hypothetical protein
VFLISRGADLALLGVQVTGFELEPGAGELVATDVARINVTLPPQSIAEELLGGEPALPLQARLAGPSVLAFRVVAGTRVALSSAGLLAALADASHLQVLGEDPDDAEPSVFELPWRLLWTVVARSGVEVVARHPWLPLEAEGVTGLWRMRLRAADGDDLDAQLLLVPLRQRPGPDLPNSSLSEGGRNAILREAESRTTAVRRLELSALGGSLSARLVQPNFEWDHEATLGRDQRVRLLSRGVLYPFGHRAELLELSERSFTTEDRVLDGFAGLRVRRVLTITEPIRDIDRLGLGIAREFPFRAVEILTRAYTDIATPAWTTVPRRPLPEIDLQSRLTGAQTAENKAATAIDDFLASFPHTFGEYLQTGTGAAGALSVANAALNEAERVLKELRDAFDAEDPPFPVSVFDLERAQRDVDMAKAAAEAADRDAHAEFDGFPQSRADLAGSDLANALAAATTAREAAEALITSFATAMQREEDVFFEPHVDVQPIHFPLRCVTDDGDVRLATPLLFVKDFVSPDPADPAPVGQLFEPITSLTDGEVRDKLKVAWQARQALPLPGVRIDMVRGAVRQPGDVHEVHELTVVATIVSESAFAPRLQQFAVDLPALRELLPGDAQRVQLGFNDAFKQAGDTVDVPLQTVQQSIGVDFTTRADRSGGLVAPAIDANGISRTLGPVAADAARGVVTPAIDSIKGTLLGVPLRDVIAAAGTPALPPAIVPLIPHGVRMSWTGLPLTSVPPLKADGATLDLTVEASSERTTTECTVSKFSFVLPSESKRLLELKFDSLRFRQDANRAPELDVGRLEVEFDGALRLLQALQTRLQAALGDVALPAVRSIPTGVSIGYAISLPHVEAGMFQLRNIAARIVVDVPFDGNPVTSTLGFARRDNPFNLTVSAFGGGGYIDVQIGPDGPRRLEASMEFGASVAIGIGIASAEIHALGGVRFTQLPDGSVTFDGFVRVGGCVEVLGLVSVSVELVVTLTYQSEENRLFGRASLVIEVDLTLYSDSLEIDSGPYVLVGGNEPVPVERILPADAAGVRADLKLWEDYQRGFAPL